MKIVVFQERGSGERKIQGIRTFGDGIEIVEVRDVGGPFPEFVDEPQIYIKPDFSADLCLNFIRHPDLSQYLVDLCNNKEIPVVASGQNVTGAITPFTCCGLGEHRALGEYGRRFGMPRLEVKLSNKKISEVKVIRGAPCGATWEAAPSIIGLFFDEAAYTFSRGIQYICAVDPSGFDPIREKSRLHYAGKIHINALKIALRAAGVDPQQL